MCRDEELMMRADVSEYRQQFTQGPRMKIGIGFFEQDDSRRLRCERDVEHCDDVTTTCAHVSQTYG